MPEPARWVSRRSAAARCATFIEQHFPTAAIIRQNAELLGVADRCQVHSANVFLWARQHLQPATEPWLVFCSPPYAFYVNRRDEMLGLIQSAVESAGPQSVIVVECDALFDPRLLPKPDDWEVRPYPPAVVAIHRK